MTTKEGTGGTSPRTGDIAIVGIGCRFPGHSTDPQSFWNMLIGGVDAITEIPPERWDVEAWYDPRPGIAGRTYARHGGFVTGIDQFDAEFFGLSRREAERMDPQQRMLLEAAWEALEDGGIRLDTARAGVGVFVGISTNDYAMVQTGLGDFAGIDIFTPTGGAFSIAANRISHLLDLGGPSVAVDTACSSALTAVHLAVRALRSGDCRVALAGGVNALLLPTNFVAFSRMSMLSPDGRCKAFDASANGFVRGEGVGLLALEPLDAAQAAGRRILAVIRATAANQDAHTSSLTVPSAVAQEALVRAACREAGFDPATVDYVEAHGTGTAVGDPIEATALSAALAQARPPGQRLAIGSVKSNIGHLEAGAGAAGLIKATLALHHATIPPSLHFNTAPATIDLAKLNLDVVTAPRPLPSTPTRPARVAVNSFGFGGANAHAMLQSAPPRPAWPAPRDPGAALLMLPARSPRRLAAVARRWHDFLAPGGEGATLELANVCHAAATRRNARGLGVAVLAEDRDALMARLAALAEGQETATGVVSAQPGATPPRPVFVYSGQGTQWWAMGRELLGREPAFDAAIDECDALFSALGDWSLRAELTRPEAQSRLDNTAFAQPAIFALQVALTRLWAAWGVHPAACVGHSVGEVAAAWAAGVLDLPTAARVIFHRGACMEATPLRGRMLAAALTEAEARQLIATQDGRVSLGAVNSPGMVTLSGDGDALEAIAGDLAARGLFHRFLQVQYAFHSAHMDPVEGPLAAALGTIEVHPARLPLVSTVTARPIAEGDYDAGYWWRNVREAVLFGPAITRLAEDGFDCFLEIGAHPALAAPIAESARAADLRPHGQPLVLASLRRGSPERPALLETLGALAVRGHAISWNDVLGGSRQPVELPREVWHRDRYWHDSESWLFERGAYLRHPLIDRRLPGVEPAWELQLDIRRLTWLEDHRVHGHLVFPAAGYIDMMLGAAQDLGEGGIILEDVDFQRMLTLPAGEAPMRMELRHRPAEGTLEIFSREGQGDWVRNAVGTLRRAAPGRTPGRLCPETLAARLDEDFDPETLNTILASTGLQFGPAFRGLRQIRRRDGEALGRITPPDCIIGDLVHHVAHAGMLDPCMQLAVAAIPRDARVMGDTFLPVQMHRLWLHRPLHGPLVAHVSRVSVNGRLLNFDIVIADESGEILAQLDGYQVQAFPPKQAQSRQGTGSPKSDDWLHRQIWIPAPRPETPAAASELAPLKDVAEAARRIGARDLAAGGAWGNRDAYDRDFAAATTDWITAALGTLGWRYRRGQRLDTTRIATDLGIVPAHRRLLDRFVSFLVADGVLRPEVDGSFCVAAPLPRRNPYPGWRQMVARQPRLLPELTLIRQVGARLADILRGHADPLEVLFPEGRSGPLEHLYQSGLSLITANTMVADAVSTAIAALPPGRRLRVLEIGAGTGGLTSHLLPRLPSAGTRYVFTDISRVFFARAERAFYEHRCVEFATLDIERDPQTQGFEDASFDLVLASDVLHAVRDLGAALTRAYQLVAPGGMMAFIDISVPPRWADLVFGVTEGWWRFDDSWRQDHAAVDAPTWERVTRAAGFAEVEVLSIGGDTELGSKVVVLARRADAAVTATPEPPAAADPPQDRGECWLIIGAGTETGGDPRAGLGAALARKLKPSGRRAVLATRDSIFADRGAAGFAFCPEDPAQFARLFATLDRTGLRPSAVINLLALEAPPPEALDAAVMARGEIAGAVGLLHLVQTLIAEGRAPARLAVVTRGTQAVWTPDESPVNPAAAPVWGLARVVAAEHRALDLLAVDLDPAGHSHDAEAAALIAEIDAPDAEREIAFRHASRFANRIRRIDPASIAPVRPEIRQSYRLEIPAPGALDRLAFFARDRRPPGLGEVEIEIRAAALNFRDVMKAMGIYPVAGPEDELPGDECAGIVTAVGPDVTHLAPGMAVLAMGPGSLSSHVTLPVALVFALPQGLPFEAAVTIPVPFLTAWHALHDVGRLRRGETVLIHAATGGVGLAAIQVAQAAGAKVLASAGTPEKRAHLQALGIAGVMDSRALDFADDVRRLTGGRGVDLVLNALAGRAIETGLAALAPGGRFLEIGKRDIYQNTRVGLRPFRHGLSFTSIDLHQVMTERPSEAARAMRQVIRRVEQGRFRPLPHRVFAMDRAVDAFRHMAQARHLGKIVLSTTDARVSANPTSRCSPLQPRPDATYLISGGLGGFGLELADGLIAAGARHLVLIGRSGAGKAATRATLARWELAGVDVRVEAADITDSRAVAGIFARAAASMPPIRGVFHAAMVIDDATLAHLTPEKLARVMAPKVAGGWNLHHASLGLELDHFVLFSSMAQLLGSQGQGNYVAANAFLVALADHRRALGRPALAIDWGQIADAGHVAERAGIAERLDRIGLGALPVRAAVDALFRVADSRVSHLALAQVDWQSFARSMPGSSNSRYDELVIDDGETTATGGAGLRERLATATASERATLVAQVLSEQVATVLRAAPESIDPDTPMTDQGLDSLMAIDLVMRIEAAFEISLPTSRVGTGLTLRDLTGMVLGQVSGEGEAVAITTGDDSIGAAVPARCLVTLREGDEPPLFLIHPGGGRLQAYRALVAALPPGRAVCAITSRSLVDGSAEFATLADMAAAYAALVVERQPVGAIHLAGFSFGGFAAWTVAGALEVMGREVGMVGLIDADPHWLQGDAGARERLGQILSDVMSRGEADGYLLAPRDPAASGDVAVLTDELVRLDVDGRTARLIDWLDASGRLGNAANLGLVRTAIHLHLHHASLSEAAPPPLVRAPAIVIASREASGGVEGYRDLLPGLCHFERLEVGHFDLLQGDAATRIARLLIPKTPN